MKYENCDSAVLIQCPFWVSIWTVLNRVVHKYVHNKFVSLEVRHDGIGSWRTGNLEVDLILRNAMKRLCCIILVEYIPLC
jgi:hypothetical protein